jgi:hypothetical protein
MKRFGITLLVLFALFVTACASSGTPFAQSAGSGTAASLLVSSGEASKSYTRADLEAFGSTEATFKDVAYKGVTVSALVQDAGVDPTQVKAIKAVATDGYTVNYDPSQIFADDIIVAYARTDADLTEDDGAFRLVLPNAEGKLNLRMLAELQIIQ